MYYIRAEVNQLNGSISSIPQVPWDGDILFWLRVTGWLMTITITKYMIHIAFPKDYTDGTLKGKNRYYRSDDIFTATSLWWNLCIYVVTKAGTGKATLQPDWILATIPDQEMRKINPWL